MIYVTIISIFITLFFLIRFIFLKKEIRSINEQLQGRHHNKTDKTISLAFFEKDLEKLAEGINVQIDETKKAIAQKRRKENELKQAISNISHDIRTPMTSILGYIQFLESEDVPPEIRKEYIMIVKNGASRLKVLLEDFFELSVIESADYPLKIESIQLNDLVPEVLVGFYEEFYQKDIEPTINIPEDDMKVMADSSAVKRVIENLVTNAIKHSTGNVTITLKNTPSFVGLTISNPAPQLKEEDLFHLFDRFYKADQARKGKGTGLGLSIAKSLMEKMNGSLSAELKEHQLFMKCEWKIEEHNYNTKE
ncbi:sensor histidine kinase [Ferdinandcohnia quinoae]|uniref:histidine kinase n=1 Tax=Fredinandcohnia quinoae TaxID=2918902 RepID=A0AAW5EBC1_9BACI|nr:HAMP domain-containing sensor histidine kinase [Fredinandcohnia sp. SECRCQ15]MCH1626741.1 HAMP domain-containing histidine kinase [Fredinandcohnia sp. SECRCQ15]